MSKRINKKFNNKNLTTIDKFKTFKYLDENDFIKKFRSLKTYCPRSYKDLIFNIDKKEFHTQEDGKYIQDIYTSDEFRYVYGQISIVYTVTDGNVLVEDLLPNEFLLDGYFNMLDTYKGMPYRNQKDKFKIDMFMLRKEEKLWIKN